MGLFDFRDSMNEKLKAAYNARLAAGLQQPRAGDFIKAFDAAGHFKGPYQNCEICGGPLMPQLTGGPLICPDGCKPKRKTVTSIDVTEREKRKQITGQEK